MADNDPALSKEIPTQPPYRSPLPPPEMPTTPPTRPADIDVPAAIEATAPAVTSVPRRRHRPHPAGRARRVTGAAGVGSMLLMSGYMTLNSADASDATTTWDATTTSEATTGSTVTTKKSSTATAATPSTTADSTSSASH